MKKCWKCRNEIKKFQVHHIDGNHENNNFSNKVHLCKTCHDLVQGTCDKCDNRSNCYVKNLKECWSFEDAFPPIHFRISAKPKDVITCKSILSFEDKNLYIVCLLGKFNGRKIYPCSYNKDGCAYDKFPKKLEKIFTDEEYRRSLKLLRNLEEAIKGKNLNDSL